MRVIRGLILLLMVIAALTIFWNILDLLYIKMNDGVPLDMVDYLCAFLLVQFVMKVLK